jgi:hypothetical protein
MQLVSINTQGQVSIHKVVIGQLKMYIFALHVDAIIGTNI